MAAQFRPKLGNAFPGSLHATEMPAGASDTGPSRFEAEYTRARLLANRSLIRVTCAVGALIAGLRSVEQAFAELWHPAQPFGLMTVLGVSIVLAVIAWSPAFPRWYLPLAEVVVPLRNAVGALFVGGAAAHGNPEMLMFLPLMIIGPFFFLGLSLRAALVSVVLALSSFVVAAIAFGLELPIMLRSLVLLLVAAAACAVAARQLETWGRKSFRESRLISDLAQHDGLTGLKNRRVFDEQLARLWQQAVENERKIAILLIDVDHFKAFNDLYGHQAGDQTLRRVAQTLQSLIAGPADVLARYGGEEFAIILYDVSAKEAEALADRMRQAVGALAIEHRGSRIGGRVTISIGAASIEPTEGRQARGALQLADQALYEAKQRGRNRVELMDQAAHRLLETGVFSRASLSGRLTNLEPIPARRVKP
jgi:diguanylate cyclase (GGDEF)-like protein